MRRYLPVVAVVALLLASTGIAAATEHEEMMLKGKEPVVQLSTVFVVIVPEPEPESPRQGQNRCWIVPDPRVIPAGTDYMTVLNLTDEPMKVEVPDKIADTDRPSLKRTLRPDEFWAVKLRRMAQGEYIFSIEGPNGGCLPSTLPNPRIVIP
jgi:hypothetical protein